MTNERTNARPLNPIDRALARADAIAAANAQLEATTRAGQLDAAIARAGGPRTGYNERVAEAERLTAEAKAGELLASEVLDAALDRYRREPLAHLRAKLAARVVDTAAGYAALDDDQDPAEVARVGAIVALELVERDRPTAEARLERVRAIAGEWLAGMSTAGQHAARQLLEVLGDQ